MAEGEGSAGERALIAQASKDRRRSRRIIAALAGAYIVGGIIVGVLSILVFGRFDRQATAIATGDCRGRLEAQYDDQQSQYLDAAEARNSEARRVTRENMGRIGVARKHVRSGHCPMPVVEPVPPPTTAPPPT